MSLINSFKLILKGDYRVMGPQFLIFSRTQDNEIILFLEQTTKWMTEKLFIYPSPCSKNNHILCLDRSHGPNHRQVHSHNEQDKKIIDCTLCNNYELYNVIHHNIMRKMYAGKHTLHSNDCINLNWLWIYRKYEEREVCM